jgi:hypothetical protein
LTDWKAHKKECLTASTASSSSSLAPSPSQADIKVIESDEPVHASRGWESRMETHIRS